MAVGNLSEVSQCKAVVLPEAQKQFPEELSETVAVGVSIACGEAPEARVEIARELLPAAIESARPMEEMRHQNRERIASVFRDLGTYTQAILEGAKDLAGSAGDQATNAASKARGWIGI